MWGVLLWPRRSRVAFDDHEGHRVPRELTIGKMYTRRQIHDLVGGGDLQSYLPHADGRVLCGCFDPGLNVKAPTEVDFGDAPDVVRYAELAAEQHATIPVFLKQAAHQWQYTGDFRVERVSYSRRDLTRARRRRADAIGTMFLTEVTDRPTVPTVPDIETPLDGTAEGKKQLLRHMRRERSRALIQAKKRVVRHASGELSCEACGVREREFPHRIADAAFEVHHLLPLSSRTGERVTTLADLSIICATCHRLIHRTRPMVSVAKLCQLLTTRRTTRSSRPASPAAERSRSTDRRYANTA